MMLSSWKYLSSVGVMEEEEEEEEEEGGGVRIR